MTVLPLFADPRKSDARGHVVFVAWDALRDVQSVLRRLRHGVGGRELRCELVVVPHAIVKRQVRAQPPGVLSEKADRGLMKGIERVAHALHHDLRQPQAVGLHGRKIRHAGKERRDLRA